MGRTRRNLYRLDDTLLRAGWILLPTVLVVGGCALLVALAEGDPGDASAGWRAVRAHGLLFLAALACPIALIKTGFVLRGREKRIAAIWDLLRQNVELSVSDLIANSDFALVDLERAVRFLNNRGLGHYVWDRAEGTIQDGRLRSIQLHVEKCEVCSASVSLEVPLGFREVPLCSYCGDPVSVGELEERRRDTIERLQAEHRPVRARRPDEDSDGIPFSIPIFLGLAIFFWPAGVAYAFFKYQQAR